MEEGPVFAICVAGAHDQATLAKWIQGLQETNPALARIPVVFRLSGSSGELLASSSELEEPPPPPPGGVRPAVLPIRSHPHPRARKKTVRSDNSRARADPGGHESIVHGLV